MSSCHSYYAAGGRGANQFRNGVLQEALCYPFFTATAIEHEPDNRFLEVALAVEADYLVTVNTARGHFDQKCYQDVRVVTPGEFLRLRDVLALLPGIR